MTGSGFTADVREELAALPVASEREARAELVGLLIVAGGADAGRRSLDAAGEGGRPGDLPLAPLGSGDELAVEVASAPVARRTVALVQRAMGVRPALTVRRRRGRSTHRVALPLAAVRRRDDLPRGRAAPPADGVDPETTALLRGVLLGGGAVSAPGRPPHLELGPLGTASAALVLAALHQVIGTGAAYGADRDRVVMKSGRAVADLLAAVGATRAFLAFDERLLRRQLRGDATRLANADAANVARSARRAGEELAAIRSAVARLGWEAFDADLRDVALARLANPEASLRELATLLGVPRATLHRRLRRVEDVARRAAEPA